MTPHKPKIQNHDKDKKSDDQQPGIRNKRFRDNMKAKGMINLRFWVKKEKAEEIKKIINNLK